MQNPPVPPAPARAEPSTAARLRAALLAGLAGWFTATAAWAADPAPGTYITEGGWGTLVVSRSGAKGLQFRLGAMGANGHSCDLRGTIVDGKASLEVGLGEPACSVSFKARPGSVDVEASDSASCRFFCGMRAWFEGSYLQPSPACTSGAKTATRRRFATLYRAKSYGQAASVLAPVLQECAQTLNGLESGRLRNDMAITLFHLGRRDECLDMLKPVLELAGKDEDELRQALPPSDFELYLPIARAAWHNARLCGA